MSARNLARFARRKLRNLHGRASMALGRAGRLSPLSVHYGFDRGTPIDRYYIDNFLTANASDIRGTVLEIANDDYSRRLGGNRVIRQEVLDIDSANARATIVGDLCDPGTLPSGIFDCIVLTQTLQLIHDVPAALSQLRRSLRPGGVLLVTVCGITSIRDHGDCPWHWSFTTDSLRQLLCGQFDPEGLDIASFGNLFAATAFLHGAAVEEVPKRKLDVFDPAYPVIVAARATA